MSRHGSITLALVWLASLVGCAREQPKLAPPKPQGVLVSTPVTQEVTDYEHFTGRTDAVYTIEVRSRVTGYLDRVYFKDGDEVEKDALLFKIDPRPYQAAFDQAKSTVEQNEAHFNRLGRDRERAINLMKRNAIGREEFDKIIGDHAEAKAALGIARAAYDMAKLNLEFTDVKAPITGRLSRRLVDPGNLVRADDTSLTTIVSQDPMYIYFDVDERTLLRLRHLVKEGKIKSRQEGAEIKVLVGLSDEIDPETGQSEYPHQAIIDFSDNKVDPSTGTLRVRGKIENPKPRLLSPGLFMHVRLPVGNPHKAVLIAEQALGTDQGRRFVYVVNSKNESVYRPVEVGSVNGGLRVIDKGLAPGERVIVSGLQRVRPGAKVEPKVEVENKAVQGASGAPTVARKRESTTQNQAPKG
jgi:RND family efflux transporter MFP subunit